MYDYIIWMSETGLYLTYIWFSLRGFAIVERIWLELNCK